MLRKSESLRTVANEHMRGGNGTVHITLFLEKNAEAPATDDFYGKGRLFGKIVLEPGESIGYHVHEGEEEIFYCARGTVLCNDNGTKVILRPGDVTRTGDGEGHGVENVGDDTAELIALILYK